VDITFFFDKGETPASASIGAYGLLLILFKRSELHSYTNSWITQSFHMDQPSKNKEENKPPQDLHVSRI
jgi:hypothetical protein